MDKLIIGAGLYGLYAALYCGKKGQQYLYLLSSFSTVQGRVQAIQSRTDDQFIHLSSCR